MRVYGLDFTSAPRTRKPITCLEAELQEGRLRQHALHHFADFNAFEAFLAQPGPWIAGMDFPFGQSRRFIENIGWPQHWGAYVGLVGSMDRAAFRAVLENYKKDRAPGDREHRRGFDDLAQSISPQKLYGVPVGLMFFEGAPRLLNAGVHIPGVHDGDPSRVVVEGYPGVVARRLIGRRSYKNDSPQKQTESLHQARRDLLQALLQPEGAPDFGLIVEADRQLAGDPSGDSLDALICAIQAAWAWTRREDGFGVSTEIDALEGWIADPILGGIQPL